MKAIFASGLLLGGLVTAWMFIMGYTGWYKDPERAGLFFLVVPMQIAVLLVMLRHTAEQGNGWRQQLLAGTRISFLAGLLIFGASMVFTSVAFPSYFQDLRAVQEQMMREGGTPEAEIQAQLDTANRGQNSLSYAFSGFLGTLFTGIFASAVIGIFVRARR